MKKWIFLATALALLFLAGCMTLDRLLDDEYDENGKAMPSVTKKIAGTVVGIASSFLPPWMQIPITALTGLLGLGAGYAEKKRRVHKAARIDYGNVIEILKALNPEICEMVKADFAKRDNGSKERTAFYEKYIEQKK